MTMTKFDNLLFKTQTLDSVIDQASDKLINKVEAFIAT